MRNYLFLAAALAVASCGGPTPGQAPAAGQSGTPASAVTATPASAAPAPQPDGPRAIGMPNPASVNCSQRGGTLQIVSSAAGQAGMCIFPSGKQCEEWALMRGECSPE